MNNLNGCKASAILGNINFCVFALSAWILFLELFLVRWVSTEIRVFAYAGNLVLLGCFIGIGAGCYFSRKEINILFSLAMLTIAALAINSFVFKTITDMLSGFYDSVIWSESRGVNNFIIPLKGVILTAFLFAVIASIFFPLGQLLGKMLACHDKIISAYSANILGSIVGIWFFSLLSFLYTSPSIWLILSMVYGLIFIERKSFLNVAIFLFLVFGSFIITTNSQGSLRTLWTPYQKIDIYKADIGNCNIGYRVKVNNATYMELLDISAGFVNAHPEIFGAGAQEYLRFGEYEIPYMFKTRIEDVLIIGSGGGNDVAGALRQNIKNIDAVEIDPGVYRLGALFHPETPYKSPRVHVYIDDARSFFKTTKNKYDLINFGLLDSHTVSSVYNNIRLDHYIYTLESFREARNLLKNNGVLTVTFAARRDWIAIRIYDLIRHAFKEDPLAFIVSPYGSKILNKGYIMYVISKDMVALKEKIKGQVTLDNYIKGHGVNLGMGGVKLTTDDWPYLYLRRTHIPKMYLCIMLSIFVLFIILGRAIFSEIKQLNLHFFFLGAAFILLEFHNIAKASLLFGSTWIVNAYTITAILLLILLSNLFLHHFNIKNIKPFYLFLCISVLLLYLIPLDSLSIKNHYIKIFIAATFLNLPIFFAGIIFIKSLTNSSSKDMAFGSNLLGGSFGGLCESFSFIWGMKALLILVFIFYILSLYFDRKAVAIGTN